jgi:hypothetical protein
MTLRDEALLMLDKRGAVLETARCVSALLRNNNITGAVIGGVSVVLHGHIRTTRDVVVWVLGPLTEVSRLLESSGATFDAAMKEFLLDSIPVHLVDENMVQPPPKQTMEIEQVLTVSLPDLINLKLRSGLKHVIRAQDLADVIGLIRAHHLPGDFAGKLEKSLRPEFRKLVKAVQKES